MEWSTGQGGWYVFWIPRDQKMGIFEITESVDGMKTRKKHNCDGKFLIFFIASLIDKIGRT